ncbi:MAG: DUF3037 domain-containing protein [Polyangiales bacterium]
MPDGYAYATLRVVPDIVRGEFVNAGVVLYCEARGYLAARVALDEARVRALCPTADLDLLRAHLDAVARACEGEGPIGALPPRERFRWVASPSNTMIQPSPVHGGLCDDPEAALGGSSPAS